MPWVFRSATEFLRPETHRIILQPRGFSEKPGGPGEEGRMPLLEGGCRVSGWKEGEPLKHGSLRLWRHAMGAEAISLRVLEFGAGLSPGLRNRGCDEVLYVVEGTGTVFLDGSPRRVSPETGSVSYTHLTLPTS